MTWPQAVATVTSTPALATGLLDRGALEAGLRADLVQVHIAKMPNGIQHAIVRAVWREGCRVL